MPSEYETAFTINPAGPAAAGVTLLRQATERIKTELLSSAAGADEEAPDIETGDTGSAAYTRISAERNYPGDARQRMRLEVRLCTRNDALDAEVRSRFLSPADAAPPNLLAGPPRLLQFIAAQFQCAIGPDTLTRQHRRIAPGEAETFARQSVLNPQRRLPILAISQDRQGRPPIDPDRAQTVLLGVATVAALDQDAPTALTRHITGRWFSAFNGAMQILWPGCRIDANGNGPRIHYPANAAAHRPPAELLRELQQACLDHAPESDFDSVFSDARVSVIMERNRLLETRQQTLDQQSPQASPSETDALKRDLRKQEIAAREAARKWHSAMTSVAKLEQELAAANNHIEELSAAQSPTIESQDEKETIRQLRTENRELRKERDNFRETNGKLNDDNQLLRQQIRQSDHRQDARIIRLDNPHPGNVTILNYAVNLYRDPMRRYIINNLDASDDDALREILRMSVEIHPSAKEKPEALIDVNDFHNIVTANRPYFNNSRQLAWTLRQIKDIRNRAAHPPPDGIRDDFTQYGLARIAEALEAIGARQELMEITRLQTRIHPN